MASVRILKAADAAPLFSNTSLSAPLPTDVALTCERATTEDRDSDQELAVRVKDAYAAGFADGELKGRAAGRAAFEEQINVLTDTIRKLSELKPRLRQEAEGELIQLSLAIARRVLQREISVDTDALRGIISVVVQKMQGQQLTTIRVHPDLHPAMMRATAGNAFLKNAPVVPDATLPWGSVLFDSNRGVLDLSIDSQLDEISSGLADRLRRSS